MFHVKHPTAMTSPIDYVPAERRELLDRYAAALERLNRATNLVARSSSDRIADHIEHCLCLAMRPFPPGSRVVDWGTGGGLPAIPLAICFPDVEFVAVDSLSRKTDAVRLIGRTLGLDNLQVWTGRAEHWEGPFHAAVSRATAPLADLWAWTRPWVLAAAEGNTPRSGAPVHRAPWCAGLVCLKGGNLETEVEEMNARFLLPEMHTTGLQELYGRPEWTGKVIVEVRAPASTTHVP